MNDKAIPVSFETFQSVFRQIHSEPEFTFCFKNNPKEYMIIKYETHVTFQRCGVGDGSGEIPFSDLDTLYHTETIDGICLRRDWDTIECIILDDSINLFTNLDDVYEEYHINNKEV